MSKQERTVNLTRFAPYEGAIETRPLLLFAGGLPGGMPPETIVMASQLFNAQAVLLDTAYEATRSERRSGKPAGIGLVRQKLFELAAPYIADGVDVFTDASFHTRVQRRAFPLTAAEVLNAASVGVNVTGKNLTAPRRRTAERLMAHRAMTQRSANEEANIMIANALNDTKRIAPAEVDYLLSISGEEAPDVASELIVDQLINKYELQPLQP